MLKVAIVGCGKIADSHASQIRRMEGCRIVAACDREELMARQFCERFGVHRSYVDVEAMLDDIQPDVVHITTPPQSHFNIALRCLSKGAHVYVEKPFTLDTVQAEELIDFAQSRRLKITAGHDDQFRHVARRMRELVRDGYLGGDPVHMESYYCYEFSPDSAYAKAILSDDDHWVRKLPGQLLHNVISHGIARIAEHFTSERPEVIAHGFVSPELKAMGETGIVDELRVIISEPRGTTAYFTFSSRMQPSLHQFRVYGPTNGLFLDQDTEILLKLRGGRYKSYLEQFVPPLSNAKQHLGNFGGNLRKFLARDFHSKSGMKFLIEAFYNSITDDAPLPVPYREILLTSRIMDSIFEQIGNDDPKTDSVLRQSCDRSGVA